jgi:hypothetical protein
MRKKKYEQMKKNRDARKEREDFETRKAEMLKVGENCSIF